MPEQARIGGKIRRILIQLEDGRVRRFEAEVDTAEIHQAAQEQASCYEQQNRDGYLPDDQSSRKCSARIRLGASAALFQYRRQLQPRGSNGGEACRTTMP